MDFRVLPPQCPRGIGRRRADPHMTQQAAGARFHMSGHMTQYAYENNSEMWIAEWLVSPEVADLRKISSADRINMPAPAPPHTFSC